MSKIELDGLPVIDADESEEITVAVSADDVQAGGRNSLLHSVVCKMQ